MDQFEKSLRELTLTPYLLKATALIGRGRRQGGNQFRHCWEVCGVLIDYKYTDPVILKASIIHDLFEDADDMPGISREEIIRIDSDGLAVYELVMEVTKKKENGIFEDKHVFLERIMKTGSRQAKILKMADRIANLISSDRKEKKRKIILETEKYILPYAEAVNEQMYKELKDLIRIKNKEIALLKFLDRPLFGFF